MFYILKLSWKKALLSLKANNSHAWISYAWWLIEPLFLILTYYLVFGFVFGGDDNYLPNLIIGVVTWTWFANSWSHISSCFLDNKHLMTLINVNKLFFPLSTLFMDMIKQIPVFVVLILFLVYIGNLPSGSWFFLAIIFTLQALLIFSIGFLTCSIIPLYKELRILLGLIINLLMFISGVFYIPSDVIKDPELLGLMSYNPLLLLIESYRSILVLGEVPAVSSVAYIAGFSFVTLIFGTFIFRKFNYLYIKMN